jgi:predicted nucleic acid-binding protein
MFVFDTSVFSYALKGHALAQLYADELEAGAQNFLSVQTVEEVLFVAENRRWGALKRSALEQMLSMYGVLPIDSETAKLCANIRSTAKNMGRELWTPDAWIMATAKQYEYKLVSHDGDMFIAKEVGIELICRR